MASREDACTEYRLKTQQVCCHLVIVVSTYSNQTRRRKHQCYNGNEVCLGALLMGDEVVNLGLSAYKNPVIREKEN
jgi:hypothetical protein